MNPNPSQAIWVELATRITTQRLHYRSGDEDTAAQSIYKLFQKCRDLMTANPDDKLFEQTALKMLNDTIRPYTARWHGWMTPDPSERDEKGNPMRKLSDPQVRRKFRTELRELQPKLMVYLEVFDAIRSGKEAEARAMLSVFDSHETEVIRRLAKEEPDTDLSDDVVSSIQRHVNPHGGFPGALVWKSLQDSEHDFIRKRRRLMTKPAGSPDDSELKNVTGLALSGGGIKSATFCLGVVQELVKRGLFQQMDYLSTVSGGGYFGGFISSFLGTPASGDTTPENRAKEAFVPPATGEEAGPVRHLRNHSKYLLHGGKLRIAGVMLTGIFANLLMLLPIPLGIAFILCLLNKIGSGYWGKTWLLDGVHLPPWCSAAGIVFACSVSIFGLAWFFLPVVQRSAASLDAEDTKSRFRAFWETLVLWLGVASLFAAVLYLIPAGVKGYLALREWLPAKLHGFALTEKTTAAIFAAVPVVLATLGRWFKTPWIQGLLMKSFLLSGPVFYAFVTFFVAIKLGLGAPDRGGNWTAIMVVFVITVVLLLWSFFGVDLNMLSPHRYYRARLCECYLAVPKDASLVTVPQKRLSEIGESKASPYHLINAFVNLPATENRDLRERGGDFFLFSRDHCGSPATGYVATKRLEEAYPRLDLCAAVAISGAAGSSNMGWRTEGPFSQFRFLLAMLNVRLGCWIPNFQKASFKSTSQQGEAGPIPTGFVGAPYLWRETTGNIHDRLNHFNVSDGGHIENLGVYELLRRKCRFIISADGGAARDLVAGDLQRLERYVLIDLGIKLHYNLADLQPDERGVCRAPAILVRIIYSDDRPEKPSRGWMVYLRPAITGNESNHVIDHWKQNPGFPYESIADQIFEEEQFEGYRSLGQTAVGSLFCKELGTDSDNLSVRGWFAKLASNLLPDNEGKPDGHRSADTKATDS